MANFFSSEYFAAIFFKAMGGQATDADPNALSGSFAGSSSFSGELTAVFSAEEFDFDTHDGRPRRKPPIVVDMDQMRRRWAEEDENRKEHARRIEADRADRRRTIAKAMGIEPEAGLQQPVTTEISRERLAEIMALLDYPKPAPPVGSSRVLQWVTPKTRRDRKAMLEADRKAREEARALAAQIEQDIRNYDDTIILLLLAA
jgi:hypothetical protein